MPILNNLTVNEIGGGGGFPDFLPPRSIDGDGVIQADFTATTLSTAPATDVGDCGLQGFFAYQSRAYGDITLIDCSSLISVSGENAFNYAFVDSTVDVDFSNLETVTGSWAFVSAWYQSSSFDGTMTFPKLATIGGYGFSGAFLGAYFEEIYFPALTSVGTSGFSSGFTGDDVLGEPTPLRVLEMPLLASAGVGAFAGAFNNALDFETFELPSLTQVGNDCFRECFKQSGITSFTIGGTAAITFGQTPFNNMFKDLTQDIDVYAPAANQAAIEAMSGYPSFGGTGNVVWHWQS